MSIRWALLVCLGTGLCGIAHAQDSSVTQPLRAGHGPAEHSIRGGGPAFQVIYSNIPGDPTAAVPGLPGANFGPGTGTTHFDRVYGSPNGSWALTADTDFPTTEDEVLLVNGQLMVREGAAATWTGSELVGLLDTQVGVNDAGAFVFATNTDGPTGADEYIVMGTSGGILNAVAQEGGSASPPLAGATWGSTLESPTIAADGTVAFVSDALGGVPTTEDEVLVQGTTLLAREGVTVPTGQVGSEFWENFDVNDVWTTPDGQHYLVQGDLGGDTNFDDVVVLDGSVIVQEGVILPGSGFAEPVDLNGIVGVHLAPGGRYFVRGNNESEVDWVYSDGAVVAQTGSPITVGSSELWSDVDFADCFFLHVGNSNGDYVIGGVTDADSSVNGVMVLNNQRVIAREGDPIDLDGNGLFDDDLFLDTFGNDDAFLADDGLFYFVATVKDGVGTRVGQAFLSVQLILSDEVFSDGFESI